MNRLSLFVKILRARFATLDFNKVEDYNEFMEKGYFVKK
jgi:hypothetical protein